MKSQLRTAVVLLAVAACSGDPGTGPDPAEVLTYDPVFDVTSQADGGTCPNVFYEHTQALPTGATVTWTGVVGGFDYGRGTDYSAQVNWSVDDGTGEYISLSERPGNGTWIPRSGKDAGVDGMLIVGAAGAGSVPVTVSMDPMKSVGASEDDGDDWAGFEGTGRFWLRLNVENAKGKTRTIRLGVNIHLEDPAAGYGSRCPGSDGPPPPPPPPPPPASEYTVGGTVSGLSGTVGLLNNGGDDLSVSSNGGFTFVTSLVDGASYAVTVGTQPAGQTCEVSNGTGTIASAHVTDVSVTCSDDPPPPPPPPASEYTVGGTVSGLSGTVGLLNNGGDDLSISSNGGFTFVTSLVDGASYAVTVGTQPAGQTCEVSNGTGTIASAHVTDVSVTCSDDPPPPPPPPASEYTVGGTVSGLSGTVGLLNNGGDNLSVSSNGGFTFPTSLGDGASYAVTVGTQPAGQTCEVGNGTGTIPSANVTDVSVTCADDPPPPPPPPSTTVSYADDVQPYFNSNCTVCHVGSNPPKGVNLTSYQQVMAGGVGGAIVIPGDPGASVLVQQLEDGHKDQLAADIARIRTWIQEGAQNN